MPLIMRSAAAAGALAVLGSWIGAASGSSLSVLVGLLAWFDDRTSDDPFMGSSSLNEVGAQRTGQPESNERSSAIAR
jgi:hypothetical protein